MALFDVVIIGGGPAGLNAAVVLGRCLRKVVLLDNGHQRNRRSHGIHNYLTRDDIKPADFLRSARSEARKYGVKLINSEVLSANRLKNGMFMVKDKSGTSFQSRKLLLATGLTDIIPDIPGINELYGRSVFHCPYCDGWECRGEPVGIYARNKNGFELALSLKTWSKKVLLFTDGKKYLKNEEKALLSKYGIPVITEQIKKLVSENRTMKAIRLESGQDIPCSALFFVNGYKQQCSLVEQLGCSMSRHGIVITNRLQQTNVPGVYVVGDASRDMHFVVVAAAEGAKAAVSINKEFQKEEREKIASRLK
jgi:thioredoxin reductase